MEEFTILCTKEQTKKALALGAKIKTAMSKYNATIANKNCEQGKESFDEYQKKGIIFLSNGFSAMAYITPTAEQMRGWLEEQYHIHIEPEYSLTSKNYDFCILDENKSMGEDRTMFNDKFGLPSYASRKEATLAAIDAALDYLSNK